jgi:hypothetical protein
MITFDIIAACGFLLVVWAIVAAFLFLVAQEEDALKKDLSRVSATR